MVNIEFVMSTEKILILGVTAGGKGRFAFELAKKIGAEILSIDSMKVYKRMDIGTAKPAGELRQQIKYHLIDIVEPSDSFSVDKFLYLKDCAVRQISDSNKPVVAVGGTAMYIKALLYGLFAGPGSDERIREKLKEQIRVEGLVELHKRLKRVDSVAAERIHPNDERRIIRAMEVFELTGRGISSFQKQFDAPAPAGGWKIIGLRREKADAGKRINARVKKMIQAGLVDEVRALLAESKPLSQQARCAIGYAEIIEYINGRTGLDETVEQIKINTRKFAKAQRTWFKTFKDVQWLDAGADDSVEKMLKMIRSSVKMNF